jgi:hypothetical protein
VLPRLGVESTADDAASSASEKEIDDVTVASEADETLSCPCGKVYKSRSGKPAQKHIATCAAYLQSAPSPLPSDLSSDAPVLPPLTVMSTCGSGLSACVLVYALHTLGADMSRVRLYDGSWSEWASKEDTHILIGDGASDETLLRAEIASADENNAAPGAL